MVLDWGWIRPGGWFSDMIASGGGFLGPEIFFHFFSLCLCGFQAFLEKIFSLVLTCVFICAFVFLSIGSNVASIKQKE